jgi:hypothetical protein
VAAGDEAAVALTPPDLGIPTAGWEHGGRCVASQVPGSTDLGGIAAGPGACAQGASGRGVTRGGTRSRPARRPGGRCRGEQAHACQQRAWGLATGAIAPGGPQGHGPGALHAAPGRQGVDARRPAPRVARVWQCWCATLQAVGRGVHGTARGWPDEWQRRGGTTPVREPPGVGAAARAPPPRRRRLLGSDRGRARSHPGRRRRRRAEVGPALAACGGAEPCPPGGCRWSPGR